MSSDTKNWLPLLDEHLEGYLALVLTVIYGVMIIYQVVARILPIPGIPSGLELILGIVAWVSWLSISYAVRKTSHFRFTLIRGELPPRWNYAVYWMEWVLWITVIGVILVYSIPRMQSLIEYDTIVVGTNIPRYVFWLAVPVGATLTIFRVLQQMYVVSKKYAKGMDITPDTQITE